MYEQKECYLVFGMYHLIISLLTFHLDMPLGFSRFKPLQLEAFFSLLLVLIRYLLFSPALRLESYSFVVDVRINYVLQGNYFAQHLLLIVDLFD